MQKQLVVEGLVVAGGWSVCMEKKIKLITSATCYIYEIKNIYKSQTKHQN
jgi:hypothetical protein